MFLIPCVSHKSIGSYRGKPCNFSLVRSQGSRMHDRELAVGCVGRDGAGWLKKKVYEKKRKKMCFEKCHFPRYDVVDGPFPKRGYLVSFSMVD